MSVLNGPRRELRRVEHQGSTYWAEFIDGQLQLADGRLVDPAAVRHLPPCMPTKILCIHSNFPSRVYEVTGRDAGPPTPTYFQKPVTAINAHGGEIVRPAGTRYLNYEGELAVIIGEPTRNVLPEEVWDRIAGFSVANDIGLQDMRDTDAGSMLRVKGQDGFCPIGPGLVRGVDVRENRLRTWRNGVLVQDASLAEMMFGIDYLVADLARHITLMPGDVILAGTPANSRPLEIDDEISVEIEGVGRLTNVVAEAPAPRARVGHAPVDSDEARRVALGNDERLPSHLRATVVAPSAKGLQ